MLNREYAGQECSIARALEAVGERWSLLIVRDVFLGVRRYEDLLRGLGIARNILQTRLNRLCQEDLLERRPYAERRYEYFLTTKGHDLWPVLMALQNWGDRHYAQEGPPRIFRHGDCGGRIGYDLHCRKCGEALNERNVYWTWGRGAGKHTREVRGSIEPRHLEPA
jgi:DNA-binding HxlR family transcriptional regulator